MVGVHQNPVNVDDEKFCWLMASLTTSNVVLQVSGYQGSPSSPRLLQWLFKLSIILMSEARSLAIPEIYPPKKLSEGTEPAGGVGGGTTGGGGGGKATPGPS